MSSRPVKSSRVIAVLELERDVTDPPTWWRVTTTLPGREGALTKEWKDAGPRPDFAALRDLVSFTAKSVADAITMTSGVQRSLDWD